jgi:hypothetical protein
MTLSPMLAIAVSVARNISVKTGGFSHEMIDVLKTSIGKETHSIISQ